VCCSVLQCVAACCSVLQCVAGVAVVGTLGLWRVNGAFLGLLSVYRYV